MIDCGTIFVSLTIDLIAIAILAIGIYSQRHTRKDLAAVFALFNICLFIVVTVIEMAEVAAALGFGLFAILSIIRLRSEPFSNHEIGYFFGALVLGLLNGIGTPHIGLTLAFNAVIISTIDILDHPQNVLTDERRRITLVTATSFSEFLDTAASDFDVLTINDLTVFSYETTYYDTDDLLTYRQHATGRRLRLKVRSRHYLDTGQCFFEVKLKGSRGRTIKHRLDYNQRWHGTLSPEAQQFLTKCVHQLYGTKFDRSLGASIAIRYRRITLVGRRQPERVTADFDLGFIGPDTSHAAAPSDLVIVEVKSPKGRGIADRLLQRAGHRSQSCSKYCVGLNFLHSGLPNNRFRKTLTTHFNWDPTMDAPAIFTNPTVRRTGGIPAAPGNRTGASQSQFSVVGRFVPPPG